MQCFRFTAALCLGLLAGLSARAAGNDPVSPLSDPVFEPQVDRREVRLPRIPSKDIEAGLFAGTFSTQNFGASLVAGLRLGYHVNEDVFIEMAYGRTKVSDESFRQVLPGGVFPQPRETLKYYNLSLGYNVLPGEVFLGKSLAKPVALYVIGGIGSTQLSDQRCQTVNAGLGLRLHVTDGVAVQVDMRDHVFSFDLLGQRQSTQNLELTSGLTFFF